MEVWVGCPVVRKGLVMGAREIEGFLERRQLDVNDVPRRMYLAPTPRERERRRALWLLARGWTASGTGEALGRAPALSADGFPPSAMVGLRQ